MIVHCAPHPGREGDEEVSASLPRRFSRPRLFIPAILVIGLAAFFWPAPISAATTLSFTSLRSPHAPLESVGGAKYLPLLQILNMVGKVGGIQEKKNSLKVWFGSTQIELREEDTKVQVAKASYELSQPVHLTDGQWMVPVDFLTTVLPA